MSGSIGKTLGSLLILELTAFQMCSLEKSFLDIGWDLTPKSFEQSFG